MTYDHNSELNYCCKSSTTYNRGSPGLIVGILLVDIATDFGELQKVKQSQTYLVRWETIRKCHINNIPEINTSLLYCCHEKYVEVSLHTQRAKLDWKEILMYLFNI